MLKNGYYYYYYYPNENPINANKQVNKTKITTKNFSIPHNQIANKITNTMKTKQSI